MTLASKLIAFELLLRDLHKILFLAVAFSCKPRGFCLSCGTRRMAQTAAYLVDQVIPQVPVR
jgi:hypothetical protein